MRCPSGVLKSSNIFLGIEKATHMQDYTHAQGRFKMGLICQLWMNLRLCIDKNEG